MSCYTATLAFGKKLIESGIIKAPVHNPLFSLSKYYQFGLLTDDLIKKNETSDEALRRLPRDVFYERQYRLTRSIALSSNKSILPKSEWLKEEDDVSYLKPFLKQVVAEQKERDDWNAGKLE